MKIASVVGVLLVALGLVSFIWGGITYVKDRDTTEIGPIEITTTDKETIPLSPVVGCVSLIGGVLLLTVGLKNPKY